MEYEVDDEWIRPLTACSGSSCQLVLVTRWYVELLLLEGAMRCSY